MTAQCPVAHDAGDRKTWYPGENPERGVELVDGTWQVRSMAAVREVLRSRGTTQAGFNSEDAKMRLRKPILFADGEEHRTQRAAIARYFAPKTVDTRYHALMERYADQLVDEVRRDGSVDLSQLSLRYSVMVAGEVVGLTNSDNDAMAGRLERFFAVPHMPADGTAGAGGGRLRSRFDAVHRTLRGNLPMLDFYLRDVRPAIVARRKQRREDVISHLLDEGYNDAEILVECVTYGAAGMVTTREFIAMATWQLLEHDDLRERYLAADKAGRYQVLHELLRLDPIVGHLYRRTTEEMVLEDEGQRHVIPAGALLDLHIRNANADPAVVGEGATRLCPGRDLPSRVGDEVSSFGDGAHKCPGNALAIQESDVLLTRLLRLPLRLATRPVIGWDELIKGYEVRNIRLVLDQGAATTTGPAA